MILDQTMPDRNGDEVFRELRKIRPDVRGVLASGYSVHEVAERHRDAGLARFVQKPFSLDELRKQLRIALT